MARLSSAPADRESSVADLLLPVVKGYASERCCDLVGSEAMQVLGGSGYMKDYPLEQYLRDSRVDTVYEGTTAIQSLDLLLRRIERDDGAALSVLFDQILRTCAEPAAGLKTATDSLGRALADVSSIASALRSRLRDPAGGWSFAAAHARRMLLSLGDLMVGWLLIEQASVAVTLGVGSNDLAAGKVCNAQFFAAEVLPRVAADRATVECAESSTISARQRLR